MIKINYCFANQKILRSFFSHFWDSNKYFLSVSLMWPSNKKIALIEFPDSMQPWFWNDLWKCNYIIFGPKMFTLFYFNQLLRFISNTNCIIKTQQSWFLFYNTIDIDRINIWLLLHRIWVLPFVSLPDMVNTKFFNDGDTLFDGQCNHHFLKTVNLVNYNHVLWTFCS